MRYIITIILSISFMVSLSAQKTVQMSAVKANDYGVAYSLPKTAIKITVNYTKVTKEAGEFYQYSERYLNISNPIIENEIIYSMDAIDASTFGVVDKSKSYLVEFKSNTMAPFLTLTEDGMLCAINSDYTFLESADKDNKNSTKHSSVDPYTYLSEEILRAGSTAKQAELIAKQIYRLRESKTNILTGEADNMPPDGDSYRLVMNQLEEQEQALTAMFIGKETAEKGSYTTEIIPSRQDINNIVFRFSQKLGVVDKDDLAGAPVYISLKNRNPQAPKVLTEREQRDLDKKFSEGIVYNIPNKADLKINYKGDTKVNLVCDVVQYGVQEVLVKSMFDNNKRPIKVIFYPNLGAVKQIIQ